METSEDGEREKETEKEKIVFLAKRYQCFGAARQCLKKTSTNRITCVLTIPHALYFICSTSNADGKSRSIRIAFEEERNQAKKQRRKHTLRIWITSKNIDVAVCSHVLSVSATFFPTFNSLHMLEFAKRLRCAFFSFFFSHSCCSCMETMLFLLSFLSVCLIIFHKYVSHAR